MLSTVKSINTTLITGANRGIGLEFCRQYAAAGWRVWATCRYPEKAAELNQLASLYPDLLKVLPLDVADHVQIDRLGQLFLDETIDLLINNAGIYPDSDKNGFGHIDYAQWMEALRTNTMAPLKMAETFTAQVARSQLKTIVTVTSKMGSISDNSSGGHYLYRSSKAALNMLVKNLAIDLRSVGITALLFHPGWVQTDMGGSNAMISVQQSVSGIRQLISKLGIADSGKFYAYDGQEIPW